MSVNAVSSKSEVSATEQKTSLPDNKCDRTADQQILDCLSSQEPLINRVIQYSYDKSPYSLRLIYNPQNQPLMLGNEKLPFQLALITSQPLPPELKNHLENLFQKKGCKMDLCMDESATPGIFDIFGSVTLASDTPSAPSTMPAQETEAQAPAVKQPDVSPSKPATENLKIDQTQAAEQPHVETAAVEQPEASPSKPEAKIIKYDEAADEKIKALFNSKTFAKETFEYPFDDKVYKILVVYNPEGLPLWCEGAENPISSRVSFSFSDPIPSSLEIHLLKLAEAQELKSAPVIRNSKDMSFKQSLAIEPVTISPKDKLDTFDGEIRKCLSSKEHVNQVFLYKIQDRIVKARIIHNPSNEPFQRTTRFGNGTKTYTWKHKYGFLLDKPCPKLLSHLQTITDLPLFDRVWNLKISNGEKAELIPNGHDSLTEFDVYTSQDASAGV